MRRAVLSIVGIVLIIPVLLRFCIEPFQCNHTKRTLRIRTERAYNSTDMFRIAPLARSDVKMALQCARDHPADVELYMLAAANYRLLGNLPTAANLYQTALLYDRRPEIYINLGQVLLEAGKRAEGLQALLRAAEFWNDDGIIDYEMPDVPEREVVKRMLHVEQLRHAGH